MRITKEIPIGQINVDRFPNHKKTLNYAIAMMFGAEFPPIRVAKIKNGRYKILDGRHRVLASMLNDKQLIKAKFSTKLFKEEV